MKTERTSSRPSDAAYRTAARRLYQSDGALEIDDESVVSRGDEAGAYVQAWVWVPADATAPETPRKK